MVSKLVLVRHAKTQTRSLELADRDRQLTRAGRRSVEARFPVTLRLVEDVSAADLKVWSSPALRALQTAEVVARVLGIDGIEVKESLYTQDAERFEAELVEESGCVIAVGHNPFMEELCGRLDGMVQSMKPGAMAAFAFEAGGIATLAGARLEWFVQGPRAENWQTLVDVEDGISDAAKRIERCGAELLENPDDPESLHQYRISLRVMRSLLGFLRPYCKRGILKGEMRAIKKLQDPTSRLRELDMLLAALDSQTDEAGMVRAECSEEREAFIEQFGSEATQRSLRRVVKRVRELPWRRAVWQCGIEPDELVGRVNEMRAAYEVEMARVDYDDQEAVHDVRKRAKALRYVTRELADCLPDNAGSTNVRAKAVQDKLGELCDCWNNAQLLVEICGPQAVQAASRFIVRADEIVTDLKTSRTYGLAIGDS